MAKEKESEVPDRTPITMRVRLTENEKRNGKAIAELRGMTGRKFWEEAMESHILERRDAAKKGKDFEYDLIPRNAESQQLYADEGLAAEVDEWAERDNMRRDTAMYTALNRHVRREAKKLGMNID